MMASLPAILSLDSGLETPHASGSDLYRAEGLAWLPQSVRMCEREGGGIAVVEDVEANKDRGVVYQLWSCISCVFGGNRDGWDAGESEDGRHLVTHVWTEGNSQGDGCGWLLVNDFAISRYDGKPALCCLVDRPCFCPQVLHGARLCESAWLGYVPQTCAA